MAYKKIKEEYGQDASAPEAKKSALDKIMEIATKSKNKK